MGMGSKHRVSLLVGLALLGGAALLALDSDRGYDERLPPIGAALPGFDLPVISGGRLSSSGLSGRPAVLALWSSNCFASTVALQGLDSIERDYSSHGLQVAILADDSDPMLLRALLDSAGVGLTVAYASGTLSDLFDEGRRPWQKSFPLPTYLVFDAEGRLVRTAMGVPREEISTGRVRLEHLRILLDQAFSVRSQPQAPDPGERRES